jgi:hypothetical protein
MNLIQGTKNLGGLVSTVVLGESDDQCNATSVGARILAKIADALIE